MHEIENKILEELLVAPLCIVQDRYGGCYSGAEYLAFNMDPYLVTELDVDAGDMSCRDFWEYEAKEYIIGYKTSYTSGFRTDCLHKFSALCCPPCRQAHKVLGIKQKFHQTFGEVH